MKFLHIVNKGLAPAQECHSSRPIEFIVPWGPSGGAGQLARKIAPGLEKERKVSLPVSDVAGATGQTGLNKRLTPPADSYLISIFIADTLAVLLDPATK
jgi:tripartite-type tricarboxylate transporter receptor subunit TctC